MPIPQVIGEAAQDFYSYSYLLSVMPVIWLFMFINSHIPHYKTQIGPAFLASQMSNLFYLVFSKWEK